MSLQFAPIIVSFNSACKVVVIKKLFYSEQPNSVEYPVSFLFLISPLSLCSVYVAFVHVLQPTAE